MYYLATSIYLLCLCQVFGGSNWASRFRPFDYRASHSQSPSDQIFAGVKDTQNSTRLDQTVVEDRQLRVFLSLDLRKYKRIDRTSTTRSLIRIFVPIRMVAVLLIQHCGPHCSIMISKIHLASHLVKNTFSPDLAL